MREFSDWAAAMEAYVGAKVIDGAQPLLRRWHKMGISPNLAAILYRDRLIPTKTA